jgi:magnesium transporter
VESIDDALSMISKRNMTWINIYGVHDPEVIGILGTRLGIDLLMQEDLMNTGHRPKFSHDDSKLYIITKLLAYEPLEGTIEADQLSLIAGENFVVSLQEKPGTHFDDVRRRIRTTNLRTKIIHPDYLVYALLDCMVDAYLDLIADIGNSIERMEERILENHGKETAQLLYRHRTELNFLKQVVLPLKELVRDFLKSDAGLIRNETRDFLSDLNDHVIITYESIEMYYSIVADQLEIYNSMISNRTNEIMKVLTIFAAIFIPLTFIAGIYGMNFENIPELKWVNGYLYFWGLIIAIGVVLIIYFRRKRWL